MADQYKSINGKAVKMTAKEVKQLEADRKVWTEERNQTNIAEKKAMDDCKSANDKLLALGLTQDEITALIGYSIPEEEGEWHL